MQAIRTKSFTRYSLVKEVRSKDVDALAKILRKKVTDFEETLDDILDFSLNQQNKRFVRYFLSRLTCYIENESGINSHIDDYMSEDLKKSELIGQEHQRLARFGVAITDAAQMTGVMLGGIASK